MKSLNRIIIPAAKIVPEELQRLGKLPAIIYPINQRIVFDFLHEQYKGKCSGMDIICYEKADKVQRRLNKYLGTEVSVKVLDELSDLGYTIYFGLNGVDDPVVINFADTIVLDNILDEADDSFYCQEDYMSDIWTYFEEHDGLITEVYDKRSVNTNIRKNLFVGVFKFQDAGYLRSCLERAFATDNLSMSTFYFALKLYSEKYPMKPVMTTNWFDIGHEDKYYNSKIEVRAREFNHITIDKNRGILRKSSDDKDKFIGEIKWYLKLPADVEYIRPRIFDYSTSYEAPYVSMEYYAYHTVHELFLYGDLSHQQWVDVFSRIRFLCEDFKRYKVSDDNIIPSLESMYMTKTLQRFDKLRKDSRFAVFFNNSIEVNGQMYCSLNAVADILKKAIPELLYNIKEFNIIHGDLCFSNMMVDSNLSFIKVIDPRGKFGTYDIYGDPRYELAKLFHSVDGRYDFIIKDLFDIDYNLKKTSIRFVIQDRKRDFDLYNVFLDAFSSEIGDDIKQIELIEALLFLSMIPLHGESITHQMAMLGTGLEILNRVINIQED